MPGPIMNIYNPLTQLIQENKDENDDRKPKLKEYNIPFFYQAKPIQNKPINTDKWHLINS